MYYSYIESFHVEPVSWADLLEMNEYKEVENEIRKIVQDYCNKE